MVITSASEVALFPDYELAQNSDEGDSSHHAARPYLRADKHDLVGSRSGGFPGKHSRAGKCGLGQSSEHLVFWGSVIVGLAPDEI
jgi:hypothetical protein